MTIPPATGQCQLRPLIGGAGYGRSARRGLPGGNAAPLECISIVWGPMRIKALEMAGRALAPTRNGNIPARDTIKLLTFSAEPAVIVKVGQANLVCRKWGPE